MDEEYGISPIDIPPPPEGWWERVPVLNELRKLLSSPDPVNWELARQVATALATYDEPVVSDSVRAGREMEALSRAAEVACEEFTTLVAGEPAAVAAVGRTEWVEANIGWFRTLMEPLALKMSGGEAASLAIPGAGGIMRQVVGVLTGMQVGYVLGYLAKHVLGQYELTIPQPSGGRVLYVVPNLHQVESDWALDARDFRYWIALHEVTHHIELSRPWARAYFQSQLRTFIDSLDFNPERMQAGMPGLDFLDPERLSEALQNPEALIQATWTPLARDALGRIQAFMTLAEGYSTFVMDAVGARVLNDHPRLSEVMRRRKHAASPGEALLERMLGLELKRRQYEDGLKFCRYVAGVRDIESLNRAWANAESLPTSEEFTDADAWIARVLDS